LSLSRAVENAPFILRELRTYTEFVEVVNDAVRQMIVLFPSIEVAEAFLTFSAGRKNPTRKVDRA
jgi:hypothetical protein